MMKKTFLAIALVLLTVTALADLPKKSVRQESLISLINEYSFHDGFEVVRVGSLGTAAIKGVAKIAALADKDDPDIREMVKILNGVKKLAVVEYEECDDKVRDKFNRKLERLLESSDLLMEAKDGEDILRMYGVVTEDSSTVKDFVLYVPSDCALICLFGSISLDSLSKFMN